MLVRSSDPARRSEGARSPQSNLTAQLANTDSSAYSFSNAHRCAQLLELLQQPKMATGEKCLPIHSDDKNGLIPSEIERFTIP